MADVSKATSVGVELDGEFSTPGNAIATAVGVELDGGFLTPGEAIATAVGLEIDLTPPFPAGAPAEGVMSGRAAHIGEHSPFNRMAVAAVTWATTSWSVVVGPTGRYIEEIRIGARGAPIVARIYAEDLVTILGEVQVDRNSYAILDIECAGVSIRCLNAGETADVEVAMLWEEK